ncbi:MAG: S8 family peptidase [Saprospiraceae bacterium]|nr:S8 family peptidase [Saprospiraceae bacterium]
MKKAASFIQVLLCIVLNFGQSTDALSQSPFNGNTLLIRFDPSATATDIANLKAQYGAVELAVSPVSTVRKWYIPTFPTPNNLPSINEVIKNAETKSEVNGAGANYETEAFDIETENSTPIQWNGTGVCGFQLTCPTDQTAVKIAILDTGIQTCSTNSNFINPGYPGYDFVNNDANPDDDHGHGTHLSSIIGKIATLAGTPPLQLISYKTHAANGKGEIFNIILAIDQAVLDEVKIINMSFSYRAAPSSGKPAPLEAAIDVAGSYGVLAVSATGNNGHDNDSVTLPNYPASFPCASQIAVASVDCSPALSTFSNWGYTRADIGAPGENIGAEALNCSIAVKSGTSQAAAMVSAVAGLLGTNLNIVHWSPLKCAILSGAQYHASLQNLLSTEGVVHAPSAYTELMVNACGVGYRSPAATTPQHNSGLELSPNPFSQILSLRYPASPSSPTTLEIYDAAGKQVLRETLPPANGTQIWYWRPEARCTEGIYLLRMTSNTDIYTAKVILQRY